MKKLVSLTLVLVMILAVVFAVPANAAGAAETLTVTANGQNPRTYKVGQEIVFFVGVNAGEKDVLNGQAYVEYDSNYLNVVKFKAENDEGDSATYYYSFPKPIYNSNCVLNLGNPNIIRYNFTKATGVGKFQDTNQHFVRFHFTVVKGGTTDISHFMQYMCDTDEGYIYYDGEPNADVNPSIATKTMLATIKVGDINLDGNVTNKDALILDRKLAKWAGYDERIVEFATADLRPDNDITNKDSLVLNRYLAKWSGYDKYVFEVTR